MLDADKYIDRLRVIVKSSDEVEKHLDKANFLLYRLKDLIRDFEYAPKWHIKDGIKSFIQWYVDYYKVNLPVA